MAIITGRYDPFGRVIKPSPTFPGPGAAQYPMMEDMPDPMDREYYEARMKELYQPEMFASERLNQLLQAYPNRANYKPSLPRKLTSIAANLSSLGRPQLEQGAQQWSDRILNEPFYKSLEDWKTQIDPTVQAASNERLANVNLRQAAQQIISQEQADRRIALAVDRNATLARQGDERLKLTGEQLEEAKRRNLELEKDRDARIDIARKVARGGRLFVERDGTVNWVYRDNTKEKADLSAVGEDERRQLIQDYALERIEKGAEEQRETKKTPPAPRASSSTTSGAAEELRKSRLIVRTAQGLKLKYPRAASSIILKNGRFEGIQEPGVFTTAATRAEIEAAKKEMLAAGWTPSETSGQPAQQPTQPTAPTGKVRVREKSTGREGTMDANDPDLKSGLYEVIK